MELTPLARKTLKARAHPLHPVVLIGDKGLTEPVLREIEVSLKSHELIKIRVASADREEREAMLGTICDRTDAQPVQHIGKVLVIYREKPAEPAPPRPRAPAPRTQRRAAATPARERSSRPARRPRPGDKPIVAAYSRDRATHEREPAPSRFRSKPARNNETAPARRTASAGRPAARPKRPPSSARGTATRPARRPARTR
jgi:RNA-binding protein